MEAVGGPVEGTQPNAFEQLKPTIRRFVRLQSGLQEHPALPNHDWQFSLMASSKIFTQGQAESSFPAPNAVTPPDGRGDPLPTSRKPRSGVEVFSIGLAVPQFSVGHQVSAKFAEQMSCSTAKESKRVAALYRKTGIQHRGSVLLDETPESEIVNSFYPPATSPTDRGPTTKSRSDRYAIEAPVLAIASANDAIAKSGLSPDQISHLVVVTCTGFSAPGIDIELISALGLPATTQRVQVGFMGCHGAINGLRVARGLLAADPESKVLLCSVELCSLHYQYGYDPDRIVSGAIFADGSASVVLQNAGDLSSSATGRDPDPTDIPDSNPAQNGKLHVPQSSNDLQSCGIGNLTATGSYLVPDSREEMTWRIGDSGYEMTLSARVPGLIEANLKDYLADWLNDHGETIQSIQGWAIHPGGSRILTAAQVALGLTDEDLATSRSVLNDHGNMSSATMLFILSRFAETQHPKPWVMLGFGPGLEIEVALIR